MSYDGSYSISSKIVTGTGHGSYADVATGVSNITTTANVWTILTNDGNGITTNVDYLPTGVTQLYNPTLNEIDISELLLGDIITVRVDVNVIPSQNNTIVDLDLLVNLRDGGGTLILPQSLPFGTQQLGHGAGIVYGVSALKTYGLSDQTAINGEAFVRIKTNKSCDVEVVRFYIGVSR